MAATVEQVSVSIGQMSETSALARRHGEATEHRTARAIEQILATVDRLCQLDDGIQSLAQQLTALDGVLGRLQGAERPDLPLQQLTQLSGHSTQTARDIAARAHECIALARHAGDALSHCSGDIEASGLAYSDLAGTLLEHKAVALAMAQQVEQVAQIVEENGNVFAALDKAVGGLQSLADQLASQAQALRASNVK
jgi:methyl-accepting chemotaxis protein